MLLPVEFRCSIDIGKRITLGTQFVGNGFGALVHFLAGKNIPRLDLDHIPELFVGERQIARQLDR